MAVMVTLTLKTDAATYARAHAGLVGPAGAAGMLFHSGREVPGGIAVIDFWSTPEALGISQPDDVAFTPVLTASRG